MDTKDRLVQLSKEYDALYVKYLCGVHEGKIHVADCETLAALFPDATLLYAKREDEAYPHKLSMTYNEVEFYCVASDAEYRAYCDARMFREERQEHNDDGALWGALWAEDAQERKDLHNMGQGA